MSFPARMNQLAGTVAIKAGEKNINKTTKNQNKVSLKP